LLAEFKLRATAIDNCAAIRRREEDGAFLSIYDLNYYLISTVDVKKGKKRKAEDEPDENSQSKSKKKKSAGPAKARVKGPIDLDKHCGVINDKGLPCSRSLTCKSHSMGAKRAVQGRSRDYNDLLRDWNRLNNPNWIEPPKRETKAEKKEKRDKEKAEKKRLAAEAAAVTGQDVAGAGVAAPKKATGAAGASGGSKKKKSGGNTTQATATKGPDAGEEEENWDEIDSEVELDALVGAVRNAQARGVIGIPLAVPVDTSSWFVARRERLRNCGELLASALKSAGTSKAAPGGLLTRA
jgi:SAGA-associated factor 73